MWWAVLLIALVIVCIPLRWTWKYFSYIRGRREYFLSLSPQAVAELNHRKLLPLKRGEGSIQQPDQQEEQR